MGLCRQLLFYRPLRFPGRGYIGSWESHRAVAEHAREQGCETTLIFEDDVQFVRRLSPRSVRAIGRAIERLPPDWMIFFLGHWPLWAYFVRPNVLRTSSGCAHAYIVSPRLLRWLHEHPWGTPGIEKRRLIGKALDSAYARLPATYALFPMIATQSAAGATTSPSATRKTPSSSTSSRTRGTGNGCSRSRCARSKRSWCCSRRCSSSRRWHAVP